jgi:hypothetical protein
MGIRVKKRKEGKKEGKERKEGSDKALDLNRCDNKL